MKTLAAIAAIAAMALVSFAVHAQDAGKDSVAAPAASGWKYMNDQERKEYMDKMHSMKGPDECMKYSQEHHKMMEQRATQKGETLPPMKDGGKGACGKMGQGMGMMNNPPAK